MYLAHYSLKPRAVGLSQLSLLSKRRACASDGGFHAQGLAATRYVMCVSGCWCYIQARISFLLLRVAGFVSQWGGMEVGSGMLFPVSVVDGLVHQLGGWSLQAEIAMKRLVSKQPCPVGSAVRTSAGRGDLQREYDAIIHTTPPFYEHDDEPKAKLRQCYDAALNLAFESQEKDLTVAIPLLGAGARGFPSSVAIDLAAQVASDWVKRGEDEKNRCSYLQTVAFGLLEDTYAQALSTAIADETGSCH